MKSNKILLDTNIWRKILKEKLGYIFKKCFSRPLKIKQRSPKAKEDTIYNKIFENDSKIHFTNKYRWICYFLPHKVKLFLMSEGHPSKSFYNDTKGIYKYRECNLIQWNKHYRNKERSSNFRFIHWVYWPYAKNMKQIIAIDKRKFLIICDNSSVHWSEKIQNYFKEMNWLLIFLPQYTPELAPIEQFFNILKLKIRAIQVNEVINLDRDSGRQVVDDTIKSIDRITILNIWRHFISEIKQIEGEISSILNT